MIFPIELRQPYYDLTYVKDYKDRSKYHKASVLRCVARYKKRRSKR